MSQSILNEAAVSLRERAKSATKATITMAMVRGVWLNSAHYLTTTPARDLALAAWLEAEHYDGEGFCECPDNDENCRPLALAEEILRSDAR